MAPRKVCDARRGDLVLRLDGSRIGEIESADRSRIRVRLDCVCRIWTWHTDRIRTDCDTMPGMRSLDAVLADHGEAPAGPVLRLVAP